MSGEEQVEETQVEMESRIKSEIATELEKITKNLSQEGSYINITQDIANGLLTISVTPKSIKEGHFDKVMDRVIQYVNVYGEKISDKELMPTLKEIPKDPSFG